MGERSEAVQQECEAELDSIAARLCTALTTLHDFPAIRYRVGKPPEAGDAPGASVRSMLAQRLAQKVSQRVAVRWRSTVTRRVVRAPVFGTLSVGAAV